MARRLSSKDHKLLDMFLGHILDAHKKGEKDKLTAIGELAHLCAALDIGEQGDDPRAFMLAVIEDDSNADRT
jgi:hypothetical protein